MKSIQTRLNVKADVPKILRLLENQYKNRGINLICIANKWSFRTASNLSNLIKPMKYGARNGGKRFRSAIVVKTGKIFGVDYKLKRSFLGDF